MKVVKPKSEEDPGPRSDSAAMPYTPLPRGSKDAKNHKGVLPNADMCTMGNTRRETDSFAMTSSDTRPDTT
uniref:Uncharacterized protein n=1 Tax=Anguilla anguilla TaxID=7936 RepID=A0A0E9U885_ANGAN